MWGRGVWEKFRPFNLSCFYIPCLHSIFHIHAPPSLIKTRVIRYKNHLSIFRWRRYCADSSPPLTPLSRSFSPHRPKLKSNDVKLERSQVVQGYRDKVFQPFPGGHHSSTFLFIWSFVELRHMFYFNFFVKISDVSNWHFLQILHHTYGAFVSFYIPKPPLCKKDNGYKCFCR